MIMCPHFKIAETELVPHFHNSSSAEWFRITQHLRHMCDVHSTWAFQWPAVSHPLPLSFGLHLWHRRPIVLITSLTTQARCCPSWVLPWGTHSHWVQNSLGAQWTQAACPPRHQVPLSAVKTRGATAAAAFRQGAWVGHLRVILKEVKEGRGLQVSLDVECC